MEGPTTDLYRVRRGDLEKARAVMADAFRDDPIWNAMFSGVPDADRARLSFFETPLKFCLAYGEVRAVSENLEGLAGWLPGRQADMTLWRMLRSGAMWSGMRLGFKFAARMKKAFDPVQADRREHMKGGEYIYLQIIGVAQKHQGKGFGRGMLDFILRSGDSAGLPVYLETETEGNVAFYERAGFTVLKKILLPGIGLPMWEMVRPGSRPYP